MLKKTLPLIPVSIFLILALLLTSCSKNSEKPEDRAVARWQALIELDWEKAYSYETPGYKKIYTLGDYKKRFGMMLSWKSVKHLTTKIDNVSNTAIVNLEIVSLFEPAGGGDMLLPNVVSEKWIFKDDQWWHVYNKSSLGN